MDEPFFGLDPQTLRLVKQLLRARCASGMAILLSTHQLDVVEDVADRVAILHRGRLRAVGTLAELRRQYGGTGLEELFFAVTDR
jgi:ABC-2 type transport system ATP-binding protein